MHVHDLVPFPDKNFDLSHTITKLTFGTGYPGQQNPLDGVFINQTTSSASQAATGMWQYFLKVWHREHLQYALCCTGNTCSMPHQTLMTLIKVVQSSVRLLYNLSRRHQGFCSDCFKHVLQQLGGSLLP